MIPVCYVYIPNLLQIARILPRIDEQEKPRTVPKLTNDHRACIEVLLCQSANSQKESNTFRLPRYRPSRDHLLKLLFSTERGGEKRKDKKSRIICRRDSANQFPIKFTGHVRKMHPLAIEQADSSWRSGIGNSRDRRVNRENEDPPLISIGLLLLGLTIRVRRSVYILYTHFARAHTRARAHAHTHTHFVHSP